MGSDTPTPQRLALHPPIGALLTSGCHSLWSRPGDKTGFLKLCPPSLGSGPPVRPTFPFHGRHQGRAFMWRQGYRGETSDKLSITPPRCHDRLWPYVMDIIYQVLIDS
ncbi:unnamed protein product [Boreogadus saida]